jgi:hypothetical protein
VDGVVLINQSTVTTAGGFPYRITQPGSYKLSGNLTVPDANTTAILITADNVTIDLNGFGILGPGVCTNTNDPLSFVVSACNPLVTGNGVEAQSNLTLSSPSNIRVVNGSVRGMGRAIVLTGMGSYVEKVLAHSNREGIVVSYGVVTGSTASRNLFDGFGGNSTTFSGNNAVGNGRSGFFINCPGTVVIGNSGLQNGFPNDTNILTLGSLVGCGISGNSFLP